MLRSHSAPQWSAGFEIAVRLVPRFLPEDSLLEPVVAVADLDPVELRILVSQVSVRDVRPAASDVD